MLDKMYIVVRQDLSPGAQAAQALHAFREFIADHPDIEKQWYERSNTIVILGIANEDALEKLFRKARHEGILASYFEEPDFNNALTACAFEPGPRSSWFLKDLTTAMKGAKVATPERVVF